LQTQLIHIIWLLIPRARAMLVPSPQHGISAVQHYSPKILITRALIDETYLNDVTSDADAAGPALANAITQADKSFVARHLAAEQVRLLYRFSLVGYLAELMVTFLLGAILWTEISASPLLYGWFAAAFVVMSGRYILYKLFIRANPSHEALARWEKRFFIGALVMAALWGLIGAFMVSTTSPSHLPVMMLVALLCTGAVAYYSPHRTLLPWSVFMALLPMGVVTMGFGDYAGSMLGAATIILTGLLVAVHAKMHRALVESLNARFDNVLIAMRLEEERTRSEQASRALELEAFDRRKAERSELIALQKLRLHLERTPMGVIEWDPEFCVTSWNPSAEGIFGYLASEAIGESAYMLVNGAQDSERLAAMWTELMQTGGSTRATLATKTRRGDTIHTEWYNTALVDVDQRMVGVASLVQDITERLNTERTIHYMAHHDTLTGLPNRRLMQDRLNQAILQARRDQRHVGLLFIDIDRFKLVNDTLGHETGDYVLRDVARRLSQSVREGDTVSREGGDEFIIVLPDLEKPEFAQAVAQKILLDLAKPIEVSGHELAVTASIGISHYPNDATDIQHLLKHADSAMYQAKDSGRNTVRFFTNDLNFLLSKRLEVEARLRHAIERNEFFLRYQPIVEVTSGRVLGMEALLRWNDPEKGEVFPEDFISVAEELGLIVPVGEWVFRTACEQMTQWDRDGFNDLTISMNLSPRQFVSRKLLPSMKVTLLETGVDARRIVLDVTEAMTMRNLEQSIEILAELRRMGASIALDDFGVGYSSLGQLQRLTVQSIKIDSSFIAQLPNDANSASIVEAIIAMAKRLRLRVVAEGVEQQAQLDFLRANGCDAYQGYLFARPLTAAEATSQLKSQRAAA
jgi:diguanylate cyclase (GGDEF)-like protein/PAS domain S-box-containing protein